MRSGQPLDDDDRLPWLLAVARWIDGQLAAHQPGIVTCSDLKRAYRDITIGQRRGVTPVYLKGEEAVIHERLFHRQHRYMPLSLFASQFETLEEPVEDEHAITVVVHTSLADTLRIVSPGDFCSPDPTTDPSAADGRRGAHR
jgi:gluconokinase